jgi:hypothetical protein
MYTLHFLILLSASRGRQDFQHLSMHSLSCAATSNFYILLSCYKTNLKTLATYKGWGFVGSFGPIRGGSLLKVMNPIKELSSANTLTKPLRFKNVGFQITKSS